MRDDAHLLGKDDSGTVDFVAGSMVPLYPFERDRDGIVVKVYDQSGELCSLTVPDTKSNQIFGVWLRKYDRYKGVN